MDSKYKDMAPIDSDSPIVSEFLKLAKGGFHMKEIGFPPVKMNNYFVTFMPELPTGKGITFYLGDKYSLDYLLFPDGKDLFILWQEE